jgi:hypothetical protein
LRLASNGRTARNEASKGAPETQRLDRQALSREARLTRMQEQIAISAVACAREESAAAAERLRQTLIRRVAEISCEYKLHVRVDNQTSGDMTFVLDDDDELPAPRFPAALTDPADTACG